MKKIFTSLAVLALAAGTTFGQKTIDLSLSPLQSPTIGQSFPNFNTGDSLVFVANVVNNGTQDIAPTDTLYMYLQGNGIATDGVSNYILNGPVFGGETLNAGDSATVGMAIHQGDNYGNGQNGPVITSFPSNANDTFVVWIVGEDATGTLFDDDGIDNTGSYPQPTGASSNNIAATYVVFGTPGGNTGIHQVAGDNASLSVYPNPASNNINVKYNFENASNATIRVMDMFGRTLMTQDLGKQSGEQTFNINTSALAQGMYILEMGTDNARSTTRFSVVK